MYPFRSASLQFQAEKVLEYEKSEARISALQDLRFELCRIIEDLIAHEEQARNKSQRNLQACSSSLSKNHLPLNRGRARKCTLQLLPVYSKLANDQDIPLEIKAKLPTELALSAHQVDLSSTEEQRR